MSRIRSLKPEWLDDELSLECSDARVLAVALILLADDHGLGRAHPSFLLSRVFPAKSSDILARALESLARIRYMVLYEVDGQKYYALRTWRKHQKVDHPANPKVPVPTHERARIFDNLSAFAKDSPDLARAVEEIAKARESSISISVDLSFFLDPEDLPNRSGSRAKGGKGRWRRVPSDWQPTDAHRVLARKLGVSAVDEESKFRDHEYKDSKSDPDACFRTWLKNAAKFGGSVSVPKVDPKAAEESKRRYEARVEAERAAQRARDAVEYDQLGLAAVGDVKTILGAIGNG